MDQQPPPTVLILNYHTDSNRAFIRILKSRGIVAEAAETAGRALEMAAERKYRLLLCRYANCLNEGVDLIAEFWKRFHVPGVLMTGTLTAEKAAQRILPEAYRGALIMPFRVEDLVETVRRAIARKCPDCRGKGEVVLLVSRKPCLRCGGTGWV